MLKKMIPKAKNILLLFSMLGCFVSEAQQLNIDSTWKVWLNKSNKETDRLEALYSVAWEFMYTNPDSARSLANLQISFAKKVKNIFYEGKAYSVLGTLQSQKGEHKKAIEFFKKELAIYQKAKNKLLEAISLSTIGSAYSAISDYNQALKYQFSALKIKLTIKEEKTLGFTYASIGVIYSETQQWDKAKEFLKKAIVYYSKFGNKRGLSAALGNLGIVELQTKNYKSSLDFFKQAYKIEDEVNNNYSIGYALFNIGQAYEGLTKIDSAKKYYDEGLKYFVQNNDKWGLVMAYHTYGDLYNKKKDLVKAKKYAMMAEDLAREVSLKDMERDINLLLFEINKGLKNHESALINYEKYVFLKDSILSEENKKDLARKEIQYEYDKKATSDSVKMADEKLINSAELKAKDALLDKEKTGKYALYGGLSLVIIFSIFIFNRLRHSKKQNRIISLQKVEVEKKNELINHQKLLVEEKNKEIIDSIHYARRIQQALLPSEKYISKNLKKR